MGSIFRAEIRWASLMMAYISSVYCITAITDNPSAFKALLEWYEVGEEWIFLQFACAILLSVGSVFTRRSLLHIGHILSGFTWLSITSLLWEHLKGLPAQYIFPALGVLSFVLLVEDVRRRPNAKMDQ